MKKFVKYNQIKLDGYKMGEELINKNSKGDGCELLERAITLLQSSNLENEELEHVFRVCNLVKEIDDSVHMKVAALLHDAERINLLNGYEICEKFGPDVLHILTAFVTVIWAEKVSSHDNKLSELEYYIGDFYFVASDLKKGIVLRAIDWIDNKKSFLNNHQELPFLYKKIGANFYIPLLEYLGYSHISEQIRTLIG